MYKPYTRLVGPVLMLSLLVSLMVGCSDADTPRYDAQAREYDPATQPDNPDTQSPTRRDTDPMQARDTPTKNGKPIDDPTTAADPRPKSEPVTSDTENTVDTPSEKPADPATANASDADSPDKSDKPYKVKLTDDQWRAILSEQEFDVLRRSGTERAGTGRYLDNGKDDKGYYHCVGCGNKLYSAKHKFHSGCGWPSFNQQVEPGAITTYTDKSHFTVRTEMRCAVCDGHLGHIFDDAPDQPTGLRHCVNGVALIFVPEGADPKDVIKQHREKYADK